LPIETETPWNIPWEEEVAAQILFSFIYQPKNFRDITLPEQFDFWLQMEAVLQLTRTLSNPMTIYLTSHYTVTLLPSQDCSLTK
jgi:hypothetical protein